MNMTTDNDVIEEMDEGETFRPNAESLNELVTKFEKNYEVSDKQDVLAMCALQFASLIEINAINNQEDLNEATEKINKLGVLIDEHLKK